MTHAPSSSRIAFQFSPVLLYSIEAGLFLCQEDMVLCLYHTVTKVCLINAFVSWHDASTTCPEICHSQKWWLHRLLASFWQQSLSKRTKLYYGTDNKRGGTHTISNSYVGRIPHKPRGTPYIICVLLSLLAKEKKKKSPYVFHSL